MLSKPAAAEGSFYFSSARGYTTVQWKHNNYETENALNHRAIFVSGACSY